jgi:hypothetical protein
VDTNSTGGGHLLPGDVNTHVATTISDYERDGFARVVQIPDDATLIFNYIPMGASHAPREFLAGHLAAVDLAAPFHELPDGFDEGGGPPELLDLQHHTTECGKGCCGGCGGCRPNTLGFRPPPPPPPPGGTLTWCARAGDNRVAPARPRPPRRPASREPRKGTWQCGNARCIGWEGVMPPDEHINEQASLGRTLRFFPDGLTWGGVT